MFTPVSVLVASALLVTCSTACASTPTKVGVSTTGCELTLEAPTSGTIPPQGRLGITAVAKSKVSALQVLTYETTALYQRYGRCITGEPSGRTGQVELRVYVRGSARTTVINEVAKELTRSGLFRSVHRI
jgi:hypothetical protein